jgi:hypothetical protein
MQAITPVTRQLARLSTNCKQKRKQRESGKLPLLKEALSDLNTQLRTRRGGGKHARERLFGQPPINVKHDLFHGGSFDSDVCFQSHQSHRLIVDC